MKAETKRFREGRSGITLVELLVVVAITLALALVTFLRLSPRRCLAELQSATVRVVAVLREAGSRAAAQESSTMWGVYFSNQSTSSPFFALFHTTYVKPSSSVGYYSFPRSIRYVASALGEGATTSVMFKQITGFASSSRTIAVETYNCERYGSSTVSVATSGVVTY
jgi:type II secretory pathway pseudopilin PulG